VDDLPTNELFRSQKQKVGTSSMVSSVVRDWNDRNKTRKADVSHEVVSTECKECKESMESAESKESMESKESLESKESKESLEIKECKEIKESKLTKKKWEAAAEKCKGVQLIKQTETERRWEEEGTNQEKINKNNANEEAIKKKFGRKARNVEEAFAEVDEDVYAENKETMMKEMTVKDADLYNKESEEMYAVNEELYAKSKESCFCWVPSGSSKSKNAEKQNKSKSHLGPKKKLSNMATEGESESGTMTWSENWSVWGSDFPGTIRSSLGQADFETVNLVAVHAYQGREPGTINLTPGEQLRLVGKDESGWVRVQRLKSKEEGYVPASYTSLPTTTRL